jgi:valyl-tRNA synthetase
MSAKDLTTKYEAPKVEAQWYKRWTELGAFEPDEGHENYSITIPPPNITGSLHMGHGLCYPIQDLLGRYQKLKGRGVLILPGQDHAGIATQSVVSKSLKKQGVNPVELGREKFVDKVWEWREESGDTILQQFRALGCGFDWTRQRFTLDEKYAEAVLKVFIDWFDRGLIYQGLRVVNWDTSLRTSVSDIETERKDTNGKLYHVKYEFEDGSGEVIVATTRPETMLADVAVAVHPNDKRYEGKVGKKLKLPLVDRLIPLVADLYPDPEFGTGAVKITPGHDANDFEVGVRHDLEVKIMMDEAGKVVPEYEAYAGIDRREARKKIVADLEEQGLLVKIEDHSIPVMISERSGEIIEPLASEQWFVKQPVLAQPAIDKVKSGEIKFVPERYTDVYLDWMENIRDWCISRQLWWGHRIPIYWTEDGKPVAALSWQDAEQKSGKTIVRQEEDVLDTWFSSGLWPFATLGWPEQTDDLKRFYPTDVLVTARDIIYLWVARMIMMGLDLVGEVPFHTVYIYATVLNEKGQRMSKSLGTGVDPMEIIETKGADALRYALLSQTGTNQDLRYSDRKTDDGRNFANKIWNASRFILINLEGYQHGDQPSTLNLEDRWILSRLANTEQLVSESFEAYDMQTAVQSLYQFFWADLCDWYIEMSKSRLADDEQKETPQWVLLTCLDAFLKMMHPVMPFITEEVYQHLPLKDKARILVESSWPELPPSLFDEGAESLIGSWQESVRTLRALRAELALTPRQEVPVLWFSGALHGSDEVLKTQAWIGELKEGIPTEANITASCPGVDFYLPVEGLVDTEKETAKAEKEIAGLEKELASLEKRLTSANFVERAKPEVVEKAKADADEKRELITRLQKRIELFSS